MSAADPVDGLRAWTLAQPALVALAPGGIHAGELHEDETQQQARGALVIRSSGGFSEGANSFVEVDTRRLDVFAFAATTTLAEQLLNEFALAVKRLRRGVYGGVLIHWVKAAGGSYSGREPTTEWPRADQPFQIKFAMETVA